MKSRTFEETSVGIYVSLVFFDVFGCKSNKHQWCLKDNGASCIDMLSVCAAYIWHYLLCFLFACIAGLPEKHVNGNGNFRQTPLKIDCHRFLHQTRSFWNGYECDVLKVSTATYIKYIDSAIFFLYIPCALKG